jgi:hypothetical protein
MTFQDWLSTREIRDIFAEEITAVGGRVAETIDAEPLLFARSVFPGEREIQRGDRVQGGVALRATEQEISVHPYVFRQVCSNGAIRAHAIQTRHLERDEFAGVAGPEVALALREALRASCADEAFADSVAEMRSAREVDADLALELMPLLSRLPTKAGAELLRAITRRHLAGRDRTRFGLMNAVTAEARDTRDPELRWRLEEFGGGIPVAVPVPSREPRPDHVRANVMSLA